MTGLSDKINKARIDKESMTRNHSEEYRRAIWTLMIAYGGVYPTPEIACWSSGPTNYYGGCVNTDPEATLEMFQSVDWTEIDWDALSDPAQHVGSEFAGTFASYELKFYYLDGELIFKDGKKFRWLANLDGDADSNFGNLVQVLQLDITLEDALEHLEERLTGKHNYGFQHTAIPQI